MNRVYSLVRCYVNMKQYYHILLGGAESSKLVCWVSDKRSASWFETKHGSSNQWGYRKYFTVLLGIYLSSVQIHQDGQFTIHEWPLSLYYENRSYSIKIVKLRFTFVTLPLPIIVTLPLPIMQIWRLLISINWISSIKEMRKSMSKLVMQPSFRAVGHTHAKW